MAAWSGPSRSTPMSDTAQRLAVPFSVVAIFRYFSPQGFAESDAAVRDDRIATRVTILAGVSFIFAGLVKFVFHHWELHAFRTFGLPWPNGLEIIAGVLETAGGMLLAMRRLVAPVALALAITMGIAIAASGVGHGDVIPSLTLAPVLLVSMLFVLFRSRRPAG